MTDTTHKTDPVEMYEDETDMTEITIQPDGRIYVFGASKQVLDLLAELSPTDPRLPLLLARGPVNEADPISVRRRNVRGT
jgi:hypothetical protein